MASTAVPLSSLYSLPMHSAFNPTAVALHATILVSEHPSWATMIQAFIATSSKRIEDLEELQKKREIAVQRWESLVVDIHRREAFWQDVQSNMALAQEGPDGNFDPNTYIPYTTFISHPYHTPAHFPTPPEAQPQQLRMPKGKLPFPEFDGINPRSWIRRYDHYFNLYHVPEVEKMTYVAINTREAIDNWYDSYMIDHGGYVTWPQFCVDICERYGQSKAFNEITEFNRLQQWADVDSFQKKFEDLRCHVLRARPHLDEAYFIECFVGGLKEELGPLVDVANPQTLLEAYKFAKRYERSLNASARQTLSKMPKPNPSQYPAKAQVPFSAGRSSGNNFKVTGQKNLSIEALREQNLWFKCYDKYSPGHQCKPKALNTMEGDETFMEALDEELQNDATGEGETEQAEVVINAMLGQNGSSTAIRIEGRIRKFPVMVLIDSGATHSFVDPRVIKQLRLNMVPTDRIMNVKVANGQIMKCNQRCSKFSWTMNGEAFVWDLNVLGAGGSDIVLGMDWLDSVTPVLLHTHPRSISFFRGERLVTLNSSDDVGLIESADAKSKQRLLKVGRCVMTTQLLSSVAADPLLELAEPIKSLIRDFADIFKEPHGLPPKRDRDHAIELEPGAKPINQRPYNTQYFPFASPVILVKKKDATWRFCVDYWRLNDITIKNKYPIPVVEDLLDELNGAAYFSKLDLRSGYHQIRMRQGDEFKTAFKTHHGLWEFRVMPFGLTNAPATFQALMHKLFSPYLRKFVLVFFDDILVYSMSLEDHLQHLKMVFEVLRANLLFVKMSKCCFGRPQIEYLGHLISGQGVSTDPSKVEAMVDWPYPQNGAFSWSEKASLAFDELKNAMIRAPVLGPPDFSVPFIIEVDASGTGIGAVLMQNHKAIAFLSQALCPKHLGLTTYEKELLALLMAVDKWRHYLQPNHFIIRTDHFSLKFLKDQRVTTTLQHKGVSKLMGLSYEIQFRKGVDNVVADALSRKFESNSEDIGPSECYGLSVVQPKWVHELIDSYDGDQEAQKLMAQLTLDSTAVPNVTFIKESYE
ncbi:PREDICTED: uncharacterized protein LOC109218971 [Nicotiana attenuata]|uniref:uncharacterized protein LOC109218971 n=1 Tax=Nicotiana attenuata TaxID=49451 RepID=UPI000905BE1B|nr:PREDICTED: uncharacterized protein LOC109218971 [Nicotiana attenuata]